MSRTVTLCGKPLSGKVRHICAFFDSRDEQYEILNPYFQEGIEQGEEVITILDSNVHGEHVTRMEKGGVSTREPLESGQLKVLSSDETYTKDGVFVVDRMYDMLEKVVVGAEQGPYGRVRTCGDMEWALQGLPGTNDLVVYEARVNLLTPHHDCTLLCAYDVNRFSGRVIADVLATHSHVVIGGRVIENQYFTEPREFLQKVALRRPVESLRAS